MEMIVVISSAAMLALLIVHLIDHAIESLRPLRVAHLGMPDQEAPPRDASAPFDDEAQYDRAA